MKLLFFFDFGGYLFFDDGIKEGGQAGPNPLHNLGIFLRMLGIDGLADTPQTLGQGHLGAGQIQADESVGVLREHVAAL